MSGATVLTGHIDHASDRAVYKQIADQLREAVARGRLHEGEQLPSETQLMEHYGVARMTVRNALRILQDEGLATAEHGRGVYVRARPPVRRLASDRFAQRHRKEGKAAFTVESEQVGATPLVDMIKVTEARPPVEIADRLGLPDDARTVVRSRRSRSTAGRWRRLCPTYRLISRAERRSLTRTLALAAFTPGWRTRGTSWIGSPRKSRPACPRRMKRERLPCRRAFQCSAWSAPPTTTTAEPSRSATPSWPPTLTYWRTTCPRVSS